MLSLMHLKRDIACSQHFLVQQQRQIPASSGCATNSALSLVNSVEEHWGTTKGSLEIEALLQKSE